MKPLRQAVLVLFAFYIAAPALAEVKLPVDGDKSGWQKLTEQFAECSAVYNIAASIKESPEKGGPTYRELANNALVAGSYSAEKIGLGDSELESLYTQKFDLWNSAAQDKSQSSKILNKAETCMTDSLAIQNQLVDILRGHKAGK